MTEQKVQMCWNFTTRDPKTKECKALYDEFNIDQIHLVRQDHTNGCAGNQCYRSKSVAITALMDRMERFVEIKSRK